MARSPATLKTAVSGVDRRRPASSTGDARIQARDEALAERARALAPVVWLLGKVQSGKTSIIRAITRSTDAEIGDGFRPSTRTSRTYEFPEGAPVLRFLDTRGLGEVDYDPSEDIAFCEQGAHLVLAVMRAMDPQQDAVIDTLRLVRGRKPDLPVVVAQTTLHEGYRHGERHPVPYPLGLDADPSEAGGIFPPELLRALAYQRSLLADLPGGSDTLFVPIDLTRPEDNFPPADYGLEQLTEALLRAAPAGMVGALAAMPAFSDNPEAGDAQSLIFGHAMAAAGTDIVPLAGALAVPTIQARLLHRLGRLYGVNWDRRAYLELSAALGVGTITRIAAGYGLRQLAKLLPVYGQTAGAAASAAASFALTYALGKAATYYLQRRRLGASDVKGVSEIYQDALRSAFNMARERKLGDTNGNPGNGNPGP